MTGITMPNCVKMHVRASWLFKNYPGVTPPDPRKALRGRAREGGDASLQRGGKVCFLAIGGMDAPALRRGYDYGTLNFPYAICRVQLCTLNMLCRPNQTV